MKGQIRLGQNSEKEVRIIGRFLAGVLIVMYLGSFFAGVIDGLGGPDIDGDEVATEQRGLPVGQILKDHQTSTALSNENIGRRWAEGS